MASVKRFAEPIVVIETAPGEEAQVDYGNGPDGARSSERQVSAGAPVCDDAG